MSWSEINLITKSAFDDSLLSPYVTVWSPIKTLFLTWTLFLRRCPAAIKPVYPTSRNCSNLLVFTWRAGGWYVYTAGLGSGLVSVKGGLDYITCEKHKEDTSNAIHEPHGFIRLYIIWNTKNKLLQFSVPPSSSLHFYSLITACLQTSTASYCEDIKLLFHR